MAQEEALWTIDELAAAVAAALASDYEGQQSGRVREVPDQRTIRYYTTLGLIDRPASMRGRTALYGRKHLLQLLAIKRLQSEGQALAEIQGSLYGASLAELRRHARLPTHLEEAAPRVVEAERAPSGREGSFWTRAPAAPSPEPGEAAPAPVQAELLTALALGAGVHLSFAAERALKPADVAAIAEAARPLLAVLIARGLRPASRGEE